MFYVKTLSVTNIPNRKHSPLSFDNLLDKFSRDDAIFSCCIISQFFFYIFTTKAGFWMKTRQKRRAGNWQTKGSISRLEKIEGEIN